MRRLGVFFCYPRIVMKKFLASSAAVIFVLAVATAAGAQDWRGAGRLSGTITDDSGKPLDGAVVKAQMAGSGGSTEVKTNKKGEWALNGISGGQWNLDFQKDGYETSKITATVQEHSPNPPVTTKLKKAAADPNVTLQADLKKASDLMAQQKPAEARAIYEGILQQHPDATQLEPYIARTYYAEHQLDPAIEHLRKAIADDPNNVEVKLLLANVLAEKGDADESKALVASIDDSKITDPTVMLNIGIGLLNQKKPQDALTWFDKSVTRFPQNADGYYYRGITNLQLAKNDAAKADLTKFLELAPNAPEAATAKGILDKLK